MTGATQRVDKWLFFVRLVKSRSLAQKLATAGAVRVNREKIASASKTVSAGDVLTITMPRGGVRVLKVLGPGERRGPASEARLLYEDLAPPPARSGAAAARDRGNAQPNDEQPDRGWPRS